MDFSRFRECSTGFLDGSSNADLEFLIASIGEIRRFVCSPERQAAITREDDVIARLCDVASHGATCFPAGDEREELSSASTRASSTSKPASSRSRQGGDDALRTANSGRRSLLERVLVVTLKTLCNCTTGNGKTQSRVWSLLFPGVFERLLGVDSQKVFTFTCALLHMTSCQDESRSKEWAQDVQLWQRMLRMENRLAFVCEWTDHLTTTLARRGFASELITFVCEESIALRNRRKVLADMDSECQRDSFHLKSDFFRSLAFLTGMLKSSRLDELAVKFSGSNSTASLRTDHERKSDSAASSPPLLTVVETLHVLSVLAECSMKFPESDFAERFVALDLIPLMIKVLKHLDAIDSYSYVEHEVAPDSVSTPSEYDRIYPAMLKTSAVRVIANLTFEHPANQAEVERLGGVELVLKSLKIDKHAPALQQWAVFAVRNLTDDNLSVQKRIAELKLQGLDEESVEQLERTGMKSKIENEIQCLVEERAKLERGDNACASSSMMSTRASELGSSDNLFELKSVDLEDSGDDGESQPSNSSHAQYDSVLSDMGLSREDGDTFEEEDELKSTQTSNSRKQEGTSACSAQRSGRNPATKESVGGPAASDNSPRRSFRLMCLGDSITSWGSASMGTSSYRYHLHKKLTRCLPQFEFEFVGSQTQTTQGDPLHNDFPQNHEGHSGWTISQIQEELDGWIDAHQPDMVLVHLGTNDWSCDTGSDKETAASLGDIVDSLHTAKFVALAAIIPVVLTGDDAERVEGLNGEIRKLFEEPRSSFSKVISGGTSVVRVEFPKFEGTKHLLDGYHPNADGEKVIADAFADAIRDFVIGS